MKTIICAECNNEYSYEPNPNYPDKRKYCANCSEKRKAAWDANSEGTLENPIKVDTPKDKLEYEIRDRECRARALTSAISTIQDTITTTSDILTKAKIFEIYIREGIADANRETKAESTG